MKSRVHAQLAPAVPSAMMAVTGANQRDELHPWGQVSDPRARRRTTAGLLAAACLVLAPRPAAATTYYVDFAAGVDSSAGLSTAAPWQHCPGDTTATGNPAAVALRPGDVVAFKRGVTYKSGGTITVQQSGAALVTGANATITVTGVLTSGGAGFLAHGVSSSHYVYIYHSKASLTDTWVESTGLFPVAAVSSDTQLRLAGFNGNAHATAEMTYAVVNPIVFAALPTWGTGEAVISGDTNGNGSTADAGDLATLFELGGSDYVRFEGLTLYRTRDDGSSGSAAIHSATGGADWLEVVGCTFDRMGVSGIWTYPSDYAVVTGNTVGVAGFYALGGGGQSSLHERNNIWGTATRSGTDGQRFSIARYNQIRDMTVQYGDYHQDGIGPYDGGPNGDNWFGWIYGNIIDNTVEFVAMYNPNGGPQYYTVHSNVFIGRYASTGFGDCAILLGGVQNVRIYNNTFFGMGGQGFVNAIRLEDRDTASGHAEIRNNLFYSPGDGVAVNVNPNSAGGNVIDHNHYYGFGSAPFLYANADTSLAAWRGLGFDTNGVSDLTTDPGFVSTALPDLHLTAGSTSDIAGGVNLVSSFTRDLEGRVRPATGRYSIGAYQYEAVVAVPSPTHLVVR